jgi:hypothetical protein
VARAAGHALDGCVKLAPLLALSVVPYVRAWRGAALSEPARFLALYLLLSLVTGALAAGGDGVVRNAFFDLLLAASLAGGLGLDELLRLPATPRLRGHIPGVAAVLGMASIAALIAVLMLPQTVHDIRSLHAIEQDSRETTALITRLGHGRAACESLALCYWAQVPFTLDFFNYGQKLKTGSVPVSTCVAALRKRAFPVLQLASPDGTTTRLWRCGDEIARRYTVILQNRVGSVMVPRRPAETDVPDRDP